MSSETFGLLGHGLSHSLSPQLHAVYGAYPYEIFDIDESALDRFFAQRRFKGINVTIPYKKQVIQYCDELDLFAERVQSVNTIIRLSDGRLKGYNTDGYGFEYMCRRAGISFEGRVCCVLGNGGVSPTVREVLRGGGASEIILVSGHGDIGYGDIEQYSHCNVLVNTTPVGMFPRKHEAVVDILQGFNNLEAVADLIYNPPMTKLLEDAASRGILYAGGMPMLAAQAAVSSELFTGMPVSEEMTERAITILSA